MGRPRKEINKKMFESLCGIQCTQEEICQVLDVTDKTLTNWCKKTYNKSFSEIFKSKRGIGKVSLRRAQWQKAVKNKDTTMLIFLGKQYLDQSDKKDVGISGNLETNNPLSGMTTAELKEALKNVES